MITRKIKILRCVLLLLYAKLVNTNESKKTPLINDEVKQTFAKLLNTIVKVNEERMVTVKKMAELQDYMLTKNKLKTDYDAYDSLEDEDSRVLSAFAEALPRLRRAEDEAITRAMCSNMNLFRRNNIRVTHFLKKTCREHAITTCADACKKTIDNISGKSNCIYKSRRNIGSECHDNCRNAFLVDLN